MQICRGVDLNGGRCAVVASSCVVQGVAGGNAHGIVTGRAWRELGNAGDALTRSQARRWAGWRADCCRCARWCGHHASCVDSALRAVVFANGGVGQFHTRRASRARRHRHGGLHICMLRVGGDLASRAGAHRAGDGVHNGGGCTWARHGDRVLQRAGLACTDCHGLCALRACCGATGTPALAGARVGRTCGHSLAHFRGTCSTAAVGDANGIGQHITGLGQVARWHGAAIDQGQHIGGRQARWRVDRQTVACASSRAAVHAGNIGVHARSARARGVGSSVVDDGTAATWQSDGQLDAGRCTGCQRAGNGTAQQGGGTAGQRAAVGASHGNSHHACRQLVLDDQVAAGGQLATVAQGQRVDIAGAGQRRGCARLAQADIGGGADGGRRAGTSHIGRIGTGRARVHTRIAAARWMGCRIVDDIAATAGHDHGQLDAGRATICCDRISHGTGQQGTCRTGQGAAVGAGNARGDHAGGELVTHHQVGGRGGLAAIAQRQRVDIAIACHRSGCAGFCQADIGRGLDGHRSGGGIACLRRCGSRTAGITAAAQIGGVGSAGARGR